MNNGILILDGGMGTMLQAAGLSPGDRPEEFGAGHPEIVEKIHRKYIEAGSEIIYANTFGANAHKLRGSALDTKEAITIAVQTAKRAAGGRAGVALDVGPIGELLEPLGTLRFEEAYEVYAEVMRAGAEAGADRIVIETFTDLYDAKAALLAAKENTDLPVWVTMSFEAGGRTFTGTTVSAMGLTLTGLGADAIGFNCSLGPKEICRLARQLAAWTDLPLVIKPNAGLPDPATGAYDMTAEDFAKEMAGFRDLPILAVGGCCGTDPDFIRLLCEEASGWDPSAVVRPPRRYGVCSSSATAEFGGVRVVGERLNPTGKKRFQQALRERDMDYICRMALDEEESGADILDVNVGLPGADETALMVDVIKALQEVVSLPLQIDSSNAGTIEAGLRAYNGRALVNSVNAEKEKLDTILPIVKKYGAALVGLTMDEDGIPDTAEKRIELAQEILDRSLSEGLNKNDLVIDCLTLTVSAQQDQAKETLKAMRYVSGQMGLHLTLGVSNISFGLPIRSHINVSFLTQAMNCGLDFPIMNPNIEAMMDAVVSYRVLSGEDRDCAAYIERFAPDPDAPPTEPVQNTPARRKKTQKKTADAVQCADERERLLYAVKKGLKEEVKKACEALLKETGELELIDQCLIPALDIVGEQYEKGILFLPQLINAANAACAGFDLIRDRIAARGGDSVNKGKIIVATVQGDVHDIGKNIVRVILENYGYQVIDLGRDVPVEDVPKAVIREDVKLVGLSALMTTTLPAMEQTIAAVKRERPSCTVWVGGAVLTPEYASEIGADYYAADARESVEIARKVLG